jgi:hypothetical protein
MQLQLPLFPREAKLISSSLGMYEKNGIKSTTVSVMQQTIHMQLCETTSELGGHWFREIRRLGEGDHQTAIITTHP